MKSARLDSTLRACGLIAASFALLLVAGCRTAAQRPIALPARHSIEADQLLVLSDFKLARNHPLIQDLITLRRQVSTTLDLPLETRPVHVYLFETELQYQQYLDATYPGLPSRRAYFVGTPQELAVYTYWGDRVQEDLRHEYTHGLLHAALKDVPLWIDEGLAEYFEIPGPAPGQISVEHTQGLEGLIAKGWRPDMPRLEGLTDFSQMQRGDYQEAWAWVHYMLHGTPETKAALLAYLRDLRTDAHPPALSARLDRDAPHSSERFLSYVATLRMPGTQIGSL